MTPAPTSSQDPANPPQQPQVDDDIVTAAADVFARLQQLPETARIDTINALRLALHAHSPLGEQPIDCVLWVPADQVAGNDYNPNRVAPPEMALLRRSIEADGYTQPIVTWRDGSRHEIVDGFHRHRVGREDPRIAQTLRGRLPVSTITTDRSGRDSRIAATIRHNRARGQHTVEGMSEIVLELARAGKSDQWIGTELGMDADEVRRLRQINGLAEMFADSEFSEAWEADTWPTHPNIT